MDNIEIVLNLVFVLVFLHESQLRSAVFTGLMVSARVKIKNSLYWKNINPHELNVLRIFLNSVQSDNVWGNWIFPFCTLIRSIYGKSLLKKATFVGNKQFWIP